MNRVEMEPASVLPEANPVRSGSNEDLTFDVFLSYARRDLVFVRPLEKALRDYRAPKDLGVERRVLRVFRDESDRIGNDLTLALSENLRRSAKLLVVWSQAAKASRYVNLEIEKFAALRGAQNIIAVIHADPTVMEFGSAPDSKSLMPQALTDVLGRPLAEDYRGFRPGRSHPAKGRFQGQWYGLLVSGVRSCSNVASSPTLPQDLTPFTPQSTMASIEPTSGVPGLGITVMVYVPALLTCTF